MREQGDEKLICDHTGEEIDPADGHVLVHVEYHPGFEKDGVGDHEVAGGRFEIQAAALGGLHYASLDAAREALPGVLEELRARHEEVAAVRIEARKQAERDREEEERLEAQIEENAATMREEGDRVDKALKKAPSVKRSRRK